MGKELGTPGAVIPCGFRVAYCMHHVLLAPGLHLAKSVAGRTSTTTDSFTRFILQT